MTLTDKEYQRLRDAARAIITEIGVETGGSNIQFAVNPQRRARDRHRDEPARVALERARVEGDRLSDREDRRQARGRLHARRAAQRHHRHERRVRADASTTWSIKMPRFAFEKFQGADQRLDHADEVRRRGDGDRPHLQAVAAEGRALARERARRADLAARQASTTWRTRRSSRERDEDGACWAARRGATDDQPLPDCAELRDGAARGDPHARSATGSGTSPTRCASGCTPTRCTRRPRSIRGSSRSCAEIIDEENAARARDRRQAALDRRAPARAKAPRLLRLGDRAASRARAPDAVRKQRLAAGRAARLRARRHLRRRVRGADAVPVLDLGQASPSRRRPRARR